MFLNSGIINHIFMKSVYFDFSAAFSISLLVLFTSFSCDQGKTSKNQTQPPNILWIVSEDNSPYFGCYGDSLATTPTLDKLASEGILYKNAFANAPVCAAARSTIISGVYPTTMGTQNMRSKYNTPDLIKFFPQYLKEVGYYTTNNSKTDYNMNIPAGVWDESSRKAHYKNRKEGQPFFAIFNIGVSHESGLHKTKPAIELRHNPAEMNLPPYHPDTPEIRHDWAQFYDKIEDMDTQVARILNELEASGQAKNTIVAYYSDHGGIVTRSKRFVYDTGTRVPMIWRFPENYKHLAPAQPNTQLDRLVSFVDLAPTMLSILDIHVPDYMQGEAFLGKQQKEARQYVHLFSDRMDERIDKVRAVRDKQFRYIKNYMPHRIYGEHLVYLWRAPSCRSWEQAYEQGHCNEVQSIFWNEKPAEELYDVMADPWEVNNLAANPEYAETLNRLRHETNNWMASTRDSGLIPEGELMALNDKQLIYDYVRSEAYDYGGIKHAADIATARDKSKLEDLIVFLGDENAIIRYWGVIGCLILGHEAKDAKDHLIKLLKDDSADVRIASAEALYKLGETSLAGPVLIEELRDYKNERVRLHAMNSITSIGGELAKNVIPIIEKIIENREERDYLKKQGSFLIQRYGK